MHICYKGAKPIKKNIIVTDDLQRKYDSTYLRRAIGLVNKGRARWIDEKTICLACPLDSERLDTKMDNANNTKPSKLNVEYILSKIDQIIDDTSYIQEALEKLNYNDSVPGDIANSTKAEAIASIVTSREATNQKLIKFLEKIYADLIPNSKSPEIQKFELLCQSLKGIVPEEYSEEMLDVIKFAVQQMFN